MPSAWRPIAGASEVVPSKEDFTPSNVPRRDSVDDRGHDKSRHSASRSQSRNRRQGRSLSRSNSQYSSRSRTRSRSWTRSQSRSSSRSRSRSDSRSRNYSRSRSRSPTPQASTKIIIEKLTKNVKKSHIEEIFATYGTIVEVQMPLNKYFGVNRGLCYVTYEEPREAEAAIDAMHEGQLDGSTLIVSLVLPRSRSITPPPRRKEYRSYASRYRGSGSRSYRGRRSSDDYSRSPVRRRGRRGSSSYSRSRSPRRNYSRSVSSRRRSRSPSR